MSWFSSKYTKETLFYSFSLLFFSFLFLLLISGVSQAKPIEANALMSSIEISDEWAFHSGDNEEWAKPEFDYSSWAKTNIAQSWKENNLGGFYWYRLAIAFPPNIADFWPINSLGFRLGQLEYGSYEVYANGQKIGSLGSLPPNNSLSLATPKVFHIPVNTIKSGKLLLCVRVWKDARYVNRAKFYNARHEEFQDKFLLGNFDTLEDKIELTHQNRLHTDLVRLYIAIFFVLVGLYHFQLYLGRKQFKEYFWFGLFSVIIGLNIFLNTSWALELFSEFSAFFLKIFLRQISAIPGLRFFSVFLQVPIKRSTRVIEYLQIIFVLIIIIWPDSVLTPFNTIMFLTILAIISRFLVIAIKGSRAGHPEANVLVIGLIIFFCFEIIEVIRSTGLLKLSLVGHWGFCGLIFSMIMALLQRFQRVYTELDLLNHELENKVASRTAELAQTNEQLAGTNNELAKTVFHLQDAQAETERKNQELDKKVIELNEKNQQLIISQQQANRIFSALAEALPGTVLDGKYRLEQKIGSGGYGVVFKAVHLELNTSIAVKVFRPTEGNDSPEAIERFRLEGISTCRVNHPNAINVLDSGISSDGIAYIVMELLIGHSLKDEMIKEGTFSLKRCAEIIIPVCQALAEAHKAGIVHRDIKPDNIFLHQGKQGEVIKVVDFGIAKLIEEQKEDNRANLTESGSIIGTPVYMAPERLKSQPYDGRADVYSIGITCYEMLAGKRPFHLSSNNPIEIIFKYIKDSPVPLSKHLPNIPKSIEALVMNSLEKDPNKRSTALEFATAFNQEIANLSTTNPELLLVKAEIEQPSSNKAGDIYSDSTKTHFQLNS